MKECTGESGFPPVSLAPSLLFLFRAPSETPSSYAQPWTQNSAHPRSMTPSTGPRILVRPARACREGDETGNGFRALVTAPHLSFRHASLPHTGAPVWNNNNSLTVGPRGEWVSHQRGEGCGRREGRHAGTRTLVGLAGPAARA